MVRQLIKILRHFTSIDVILPKNFHIKLDLSIINLLLLTLEILAFCHINTLCLTIVHSLYLTLRATPKQMRRILKIVI